MKQGFFKSVRNFFNGKPPPVSKNGMDLHKTEVPRVVNFGSAQTKQKLHESQKQYRDSTDSRYEKIDVNQSLKDFGLKKDEVEEGQSIVFADSKFMLCKGQSNKYQNLTVIITDYQLFLKFKDRLAYFPLGKIQKLHKYTNNQNFYKLLIQLKDGRRFKIRVLTERMWKNIYDVLEKFSFVRIKRQFFAFKHFQHNYELQKQHQGWNIYDIQKQFNRMGISMMSHTQQMIDNFTSDFKFLDNRQGKICTTYAQKFIIPSRMPYDYLVRGSKFRSRCRMPALTFAFQYDKQKFSTLYRASQAKVGVQKSRSPEDQMMLRLIGDHKHDQKNNSTILAPNCYIYDARNKMAAIGNMISGKGYESQEYYPNCKLQFLNIPNIHAVRESYLKVQKAAWSDDSKFYQTLAQSEWYDFVFLIIDGALSIAKNLNSGVNVLVHCSDGWDRTSQLCSLASILLDPYYRSIQGFEVLIEKDWIRFGHQFQVRMGQGVNNPTGQEKSQVFLQFLDCVSQLLSQFPMDFQFNYHFLQQIANLSYSHLYGNFLCNCQLEMKKNFIETETISLWSYFAKMKQQYTNPYYTKIENRRLLDVSSAQKHFRFWKEHFLEYVDDYGDIYDIYSCKFTEDNLDIMYKHLKQERMLLQEKCQQNDQEINQLQNKDQKQTQLQKPNTQNLQTTLFVKVDSEKQNSDKEDSGKEDSEKEN